MTIKLNYKEDISLKYFTDNKEIEKRKELYQLFNDWRKVISKNEKIDGREPLDFFSTDGFYPGYFSSKTKILFITQEAKENFDTVDTNLKWLKSNNPNTNTFWRKLISITYMIKHEKKHNNIPSSNEILKNMINNNDYGFAIMSLSKYANTSKTNYNSDYDLINLFLSDSNLDNLNFIYKEIQLLEPDLILISNLWKQEGTWTDGFDPYQIKKIFPIELFIPWQVNNLSYIFILNTHKYGAQFISLPDFYSDGKSETISYQTIEECVFSKINLVKNIFGQNISLLKSKTRLNNVYTLIEKDNSLKYFTNTIDIEKRKELFMFLQSWKKQCKNNSQSEIFDVDNYFVLDGFFPGYFSKKKILFINQSSKYHNDFVEQSLNWLKIHNPNYNTFWRRILTSTYIIQNNITNMNLPSPNEILKNMSKTNNYGFAIINISKYFGKQFINHSVKDSYTSHSNFLKEEISLLNPDVIITSNLWDSVDQWNKDFDPYEFNIILPRTDFTKISIYDSISTKRTVNLYYAYKINSNKQIQFLNTSNFNKNGKEELKSYKTIEEKIVSQAGYFKWQFGNETPKEINRDRR